MIATQYSIRPSVRPSLQMVRYRSSRHSVPPQPPRLFRYVFDLERPKVKVKDGKSQKNAAILPQYTIVRFMWRGLMNGKCLRKNIELIEGVHRRATKLVKGVEHLHYNNRLEHLGLMCLHTRRIRSDLIDTYKIINGIYNFNQICF